jgi:hypothetical protein
MDERDLLDHDFARLSDTELERFLTAHLTTVAVRWDGERTLYEAPRATISKPRVREVTGTDGESIREVSFKVSFPLVPSDDNGTVSDPPSEPASADGDDSQPAETATPGEAETATDGGKTERKADMRRKARRLDHGERSGSVGAEGGDFDAMAPQEGDNRSHTVTGFDPTDVDDNESVRRNGKTYEKWRWLNILNDGMYADDRHEQNSKANLKRDIAAYCKHINEIASKQGCDHEIDPDEVTRFLIEAREERDGGISFGSGNPLEATILSAITLVANQDGWMIRSEPKNDGQPVFDELLEEATPQDSDVDRGSVRQIREHLREYL